MEGTALDFLLEKMQMQFSRLIRSQAENELLELHERIYKEMQFLQKFVMNSRNEDEDDEEVKDVVAKIGNVTCKVEDMVDLFYLVSETQTPLPPGFRFSLERVKSSRLRPRKFHMAKKNLQDSGSIDPLMKFETSSDYDKDKSVSENMVDLAQRIYDRFKPLVEDIDSSMNCCVEMKRIVQVMEIEEIEKKKSGFGVGNTSHGASLNFCVEMERIVSMIRSWSRLSSILEDLIWIESEVIDEFCGLYNLSGKLSYVLMMGMSLTWPEFCALDDCLHLSNIFNYMVDLAQRTAGVFGRGLIMKLKLDHWVYCTSGLNKKFEMEVGFTREMDGLNLALKLLALAEKITNAYGGVVMEDNKPVLVHVSIASATSRLKRLMTDNICHGFGSVIEEIESIKKQVMEISDKKKTTYGFGVGNSSHVAAAVRAPKRLSVEEEMMVGFSDQKTTIIELLIAEHQKQLKLVPIIGMPGLGKTTLAKNVYNDPFIIDYFPIRAWTYVSQVYQKRDLLLAILHSAFYFRDEISTLSDVKLGEELYRRLKGKRYLIVMDDIWNIGAWDDVKNYIPDDNNGSTIMFTSRLSAVAVALHPEPHHLRFLNLDESWDLLQQRVFQRESCPRELTKIGMQIAQKCQGLPLAIVVIAGLLAQNVKIVEWWAQVAAGVSSYIASDPEKYMDTLTLSYNHLTRPLKSCFLYFGAFPEDYEIPVRKLVWLWIAEGFIHQIGGKSLEDVAEDYLMDLIDRNLVLVVRRRSTGGIKACRVHDLLHDLCLRKAKEENFLQQIYWCEQVSSSSCTTNKQLFLSIAAAKQRRLCIHSHNFHDISSELFAPYIRSFLHFGSEQSPIPTKNMSFIEKGFKLLRVLDLSSITISKFSYSIVQLVLLRYLALQGKELELPCNISQLQNLETLIVSKGGLTYLPTNIWNMVKLRHLCIAGENVVAEAEENGFQGSKWSALSFTSKAPNPRSLLSGNFLVLNDLQTISQVRPSSECQKVLARTPNLQKLVFCGCFESKNGGFWKDSGFWFPDLDHLNHLKILKLFNRYIPDNHKYNLQGVKFPPNLKELTLSNTALPWEEMSIIGSLPNLESLKLEFQACVGPQWETSDGGFCRLKFLRFYYMNIVQWNASSHHFPVLEHLVLHRCRQLERIPSEFGDIDTLQMIKVSCCSDTAINSAKHIQEEQQDMGNVVLKILIVNSPDFPLTL